MVDVPSFGLMYKCLTPLDFFISTAFYSLPFLVILSFCMFTVIVDISPICHKDLIMLAFLLVVSFLFHLVTLQ